MKKRGFTLIELLAVIVILAIIALIATPIVMNVIENTRKGAAERSAKSIEHAAELYFYSKKLDKGFDGITFTCKDNKCSNGKETLSINGKVPENGLITINRDGTIALNSIVINGYSCFKSGESYTCDKSEKIRESAANGVLTLNESKTTTLSNYIIKGNSYQATRSGKNLLDIYKYYNDYMEGEELIFNQNQASAVSKIIVNNGEFEENTQYTLSADILIYNAENNGIKIYFYDENDNVLASLGNLDVTGTDNIIGSITNPENTTIKYVKMLYNTATRPMDVSIIYFQIEKGSSATSYEPYGAMPSVEFPSEIQSVGNLVTEEGPNKGKYEIPIKVTGNNLLNINKSYSGSNYIEYKIENGVLIATVKSIPSGGSAFIAGIKIDHLKPNTDYSISGIPSAVKVSKIYIYSDELWGNRIYENIFENNSMTFNTGNNTSIVIGFYWKGITESDIGTTETIANLQLKEGVGSTEYESYKESRYSIYLDEPLRCLEDICDYIDYSKGNVFKYIKVKENYTPTETIKNNFEVLTNPIEQTTTLPAININKEVSNIFVETDIKPREITVDYYK